MLELLQLTLKLLDGHPGGVVAMLLVAGGVIYAQAYVVLTVRYMRKYMVSNKDFQIHKLEVQDLLLVQAQAIAQEYPTKQQCAAMIQAAAGRGNGKAAAAH